MERFKHTLFCSLLSFSALLLSGCLNDHPISLTRYEQTRPQMGTLFTITLYAPDGATATNAFDSAFARVSELNLIFSDYEKKSEISILINQVEEETRNISPELTYLLARCRDLHQQTDGAFDPTLGLMIQHWRRARRQRQLPTEETITQVRKHIGFEKLTFDQADRTIRIVAPELMIDFGGIAKGYAADEAMQTINAHGITRVLIAASGDILAGEPPPGESTWTIGVQSADVTENNFTTLLQLRNQAASTSGDASQHALINGRKYSHIVDPKTGIGLTERIGVTILAKDATTSDSLATAVSVLGKEKGLRLIESFPDVEALIVTQNEDGESFIKTRSSGFPKGS
ncbi:FAD:protein FMN transferase [Verrucomicrobia bacterium]|nr:FAD:protein FMN transferase [Verrucomicrobiota bacterium]